MNRACSRLLAWIPSPAKIVSDARFCSTLPPGTPNPYEKEKVKCLLCTHNVKLDYKNSRLLQQFVSSFSGRVYDRHITGLCSHQHNQLLKTVALSRRAGYMPIFVKDPKYLRDAKLFDPMKPLRSHSFA